MKRAGLLYMILFFFCQAETFLHAQPFLPEKMSIRHIGSAEGLLFSPVHCFLQDDKGFIWMGGKALQRFDGYRFKNYFDGSEHLLVQALCQDRQRHFWAATDKGLYRYNTATDQFELFQDSIRVDGKTLLLNTTCISEDGGGRLWVAGSRFYASLNKAGNRVEDVSEEIGYPKTGDGGFISKDFDGNIWFRFPAPFGIVRYNWKTRSMTSHTNNPLHEQVFDINTGNVSVLPDKNGNIWYTQGFDERILYRYNTGAQQLFHYQLRYPPYLNKDLPAIPGNMITDLQGKLWVQMEEGTGIACYNNRTDSFEYLFSDNNSKNGLHDTYTIANASGGLFEDRQGNFWQGGSEVNFFAPYKQIFQPFRLSDQVALAGVAPKAPVYNTSSNGYIIMPDGKLYISFYGDGLWRLNEDLRPEKKIQFPPTASPLIWHIAAVNEHTILVGDQFKNKWLYNISTEKIIPANINVNGFINTSYRSSDSALWLGLWPGGLLKLNTSALTAQEMNNVFPANGQNNSVLSIAAIKKDEIWLGTKSGLYLFNTRLEKTTGQYFTSMKDGPCQVFHVNPFGNDTLLLSTSKGLIIFSSETKQGKLLGIKEGLPDYQCYSTAVEKNRHYIWINTASKGLCRLQLPSLHITTFLSNDGTATQNGDVTNFIMRNGLFLFSDVNGFTLVNAQLAHSVITTKKPVITDISINGISQNAVYTNNNNQVLRLAPGENTIRISFSTLDFYNCQSQGYAVWLAGADTGWVSIGMRSQVEYRNLSPGKYRLLLKCITDDVSDPGSATSFSFIIRPPFWKRWWFTALSACLLLSVIYLLYRIRIRNIRKEETIKATYNRRIIESEVKALRAQMNPHFIFNSLNAINRYILKNEKKEASEYLSKFSKLVRLILDNSRQARIPLARELDAVELYLALEKLRFQNNFSHEIRVDENISADSVFIPPMIIQPIVENAIWHGLLPKGAGSHLRISMLTDQQYLICTVEDNGIGRENSARMKQGQVMEKSSVGLSTTEQRLQLINSGRNMVKPITITDLYNASGEAAGTRVTLYIPYFNKP